MINITRNDERGKSDEDWLHTRFSYSFANYMNPHRMGFGVLRVVNDDSVAPQSGFPMHQHAQMEIVTVMLAGILTHEDSLGNKKEITKGEVQVMTAGTGVTHSEWNHSSTEVAALLQIWIYPKERALMPRYDQKRFDESERVNVFQVLVSGVKKEGALFIHQDAQLARGAISKGKSVTYVLTNNTHGVFAFVVKGRVTVGIETLLVGDSIEIKDEDSVTFLGDEESDVLVIEVPLL